MAPMIPQNLIRVSWMPGNGLELLNLRDLNILYLQLSIMTGFVFGLRNYGLFG